MTTPASTDTESAASRARRVGEGVPAPLVFVGGSGRSGTHVVARLLGHHSRYLNVSNEVRFHAAAGGFPDLLSGTVDLDQFLRSLRKRWWRDFEPVRMSFRGLHRHISRERFEIAVERFRSSFATDREGACRELFFELLWPLAEQAKKPGLIEMSCDTIAAAPTLIELFPEAKFVHCVRDGRDAAASRSSQGGRLIGPRNLLEGIDWWDGRMREMNRGARPIASDRIMVVSLDELVALSRKRTLRRLMRFLKLESEPGLTAFFHRRMNSDNAHRERWRGGLDEATQAAVDARYREVLERLEADNIQGWRALCRVQQELDKGLGR